MLRLQLGGSGWPEGRKWCASEFVSLSFRHVVEWQRPYNAGIMLTVVNGHIPALASVIAVGK